MANRLEEALRIVKAAGIKIDLKTIRLKRPEIKRIEEMLMLEKKCVVCHNMKRATVFGMSGYRRRKAAAKVARAARTAKSGGKK